MSDDSMNDSPVDEALGALMRMAEDRRAALDTVMQAVTDIQHDPSPTVITLAKQCSNALSETEAVVAQLQNVLRRVQGLPEVHPADNLNFVDSGDVPSNAPAARQAKAEWARMSDMQRSRWIDANTYIRVRARQITGAHR